MKKINTDETDEFEKYKLNLSRCSNPDVKALKQWSFVLTRANEIRGPRELHDNRRLSGIKLCISYYLGI